MKQWMQKLIEQLDYGPSPRHRETDEKQKQAEGSFSMSEDRATLLYIIDCYTKHLFSIDTQPIRKAREAFDELAKELLKHTDVTSEKTLFRLRQFFSAYRVDEYAYVVKAFEDFKGIVWDFVDQLSDDFKYEQNCDHELQSSLKSLKDAVEAESVDQLRSKSREFIDAYIERQSKIELRRSKRLKGVRKNLTTVKKRLVEANQTARLDHMTGAHNRKSFDEELNTSVQLLGPSGSHFCLAILDIDHFKSINDRFGHDIGDFAIKELVRLTREHFCLEEDFFARIGGEEFALILPHHDLAQAEKRLTDLIAKFQKEVFVLSIGQELRFTVSIGLAQWVVEEKAEALLKRADQALYDSKQNGRNRLTSSPNPKQADKGKAA